MVTEIESAQKAVSGEEHSPTASARTREPSVHRSTTKPSPFPFLQNHAPEAC